MIKLLASILKIKVCNESVVELAYSRFRNVCECVRMRAIVRARVCVCRRRVRAHVCVCLCVCATSLKYHAS